MNSKRFWTGILFLSICAIAARAQMDVSLNHYFMAMGAYNPASVGMKNELSITALYRLQWLGLDRGMPQSAFVAADMPFSFGKTRHGVGVMFFSDDKSTLYKDVYTSLQYAYKHKLGKGELSIGLQGGMLSKSYLGSKAEPVPEGIDGSTDHSSEDEALPKSDIDAKGLDVALGLFYSTDRYYIGVASTHVLAPEMELDENFTLKVNRGYNLTAGYNIKLKNPLIELQPSVFMQTDLQMYMGDVTVRAVYRNMFIGGLGVRLGDSYQGLRMNGILYLGANIGKFRVSYAYGYPFSALSKVSMGSHEAMATYRLTLNKPKGGRNRHKSIRIL
ncbi:PorP/SprF family type IX secretion system membrane protein [Tannerella sp.]|uniref:PorP/SprF family type IX secretion system membrane protein n=1 Tax=Tannerella sp. TaxID=2382127 RepID=UPI0026DB45DC|nr:PorP/SprF family type IX secretion system membrane protein [Tannerella sp.]MDO4704309.1 PorP/SprF family type IX secretion system membrane protein [Tannerella sp.]